MFMSPTLWANMADNKEYTRLKEIHNEIETMAASSPEFKHIVDNYRLSHPYKSPKKSNGKKKNHGRAVWL